MLSRVLALPAQVNTHFFPDDHLPAEACMLTTFCPPFLLLLNFAVTNTFPVMLGAACSRMSTTNFDPLVPLLLYLACRASSCRLTAMTGSLTAAGARCAT
jgi:hypothetical protein